MPRIVVPRSAKQGFISAFAALPPLLAVDAARRGIRGPRRDRAGWALMTAIHTLPGAYFANGFLRPKARMSADLVGLQAATAAGLALGLRFARRHPRAWGLAAIEALGWLAYIRWYSWFGRQPSQALWVGGCFRTTCPSWSKVAAPHLGRFARQADRAAVLPRQLVPVVPVAGRRDRRTLAGGRGNGAQVVLVSPQDEAHTRSLASRHGVGFRYLRDEDLVASRRLGIVDPNGTPSGMIGYEGDTVLPTLVVTDSEGRIVFADQTDNYRVRPTPDTVLTALGGDPLRGNGAEDSSAIAGA